MAPFVRIRSCERFQPGNRKTCSFSQINLIVAEIVGVLRALSSCVRTSCASIRLESRDKTDVTRSRFSDISNNIQGHRTTTTTAAAAITARQQPRQELLQQTPTTAVIQHYPTATSCSNDNAIIRSKHHTAVRHDCLHEMPRFHITFAKIAIS